jgi:hypothetical protein
MHYRALFAAAALALAGCESTTGTVTLGVLGATGLGGYSPNNELQQTYYLGVFDPQEQLPPTVYRVRVHGQSSFVSQTRFASGWVPAEIIDSLGTQVRFDQESGKVEIGKDEKLSSALKTGRRLMLFGPQGFREAPRDHRLVIVMGSSPESFFSAVDQSLGVVAQVTQAEPGGALDRRLFEALVLVSAEREDLKDLLAETERDLGGKK